MGRIRATTETFAAASGRKPWSTATYPFPDPRLVPDPTEPVSVAQERLFWRSDGSLAYRAGKEYATKERPVLCTWDELIELQKAGAL